MGRLIIERRISGKTGESAENSVMDLMSFFCLQAYTRKDFCRLLDSFWCVMIFFLAGTAASCFSGRMQEKQGLWEFKRGILYQIYTNFLGFWAVTWLVKKWSSMI
ncbi:MAG: hypothetical protein ACI4E2_03795 [Acetatifactor sp.]